jgi:protein involved in polysaccharide export with SLBB domain/capsular polysaccharide biosynthesis protein
MNDHSEPEQGPPASFKGHAQENHIAVQGQNQGINGFSRDGHSHASARPQKEPSRMWLAMEVLLHRWHWLVLGALIGGAGFYLLASGYVKPKFTAMAQLRRLEPRGVSENFKGNPISADTFASLIKSQEVLRKTGEEVNPPVLPEILGKLIKVEPDPDSDMVKVALAARDARLAVCLMNLFLTNAVDYVRELDGRQFAMMANDYLKKQVTELKQDISDVQTQFVKLPMGGLVTSKLARMSGQLERLSAAQAELKALLHDFLPAYPRVQAKQAEIREIEQQIAEGSNATNLVPAELLPPIAGAGKTDAVNPEVEMIHIKMKSLADGLLQLVQREREAELYATNPPATVQIFAPANLASVKGNMRQMKIMLGTIFGGGLGLIAGILLVLLVEFLDNRLKTAEDIQRVTRLPVLTSLGDLQSMNPEERSQWAFRAWTMLQGRLSASSNSGLVCGITSSAAGEGRSTWISLLAQAASLTGFRVLTVATRPSPTHTPEVDGLTPDMFADEIGTNSDKALTTSVLSTPSQVTEQLTGPNPQPVVNIPLPGWVWNLERRKQWREALEHWRQIDNLVIFVELPPASVPEAVLLGSNLPNMVWLADSGKSHAGPTRTQLETLRHARCNLVGAVLNREPGVPLRKCFPRWLGCILVGCLGITNLHARQTNFFADLPTAVATNAPATTNAPEDAPRTGSISIIGPGQRAAWQQHFTLGPGDVLTFSLYDHPELTRFDIPIGPDGRVNYLEATNVMAADLTVDELRARMDEELGQYRRAPHTLIMPVAYHSKKYYMLGKVTTKGVYTLDRPLTVLEALARAHGLESALIDRNLVSLTDFQRSFLARGGRRFPLDFERLFGQGDLSQNIAIEPGDYIYFAPGDVSQVYVVGEIRLPGPVTFTPDMTIINAVAARGGFTERAYRARVVVVRGSLNNPDAIAVDTHAILDAREPNFKLRPRDIIYVNSRPFIKVEEALDLAATAFIQSAINSVVGVHVVRPF